LEGDDENIYRHEIEDVKVLLNNESIVLKRYRIYDQKENTLWEKFFGNGKCICINRNKRLKLNGPGGV